MRGRRRLEEKAVTRRQAQVLVVDDEQEILDLIKLYLERENYIVHTAFTGEDAIRMATEWKPDLIILDIMLGGLDGIEVCRCLRASECADVPILFVSARSEDNDIVTALAEGGDDYMTKPFSPSQLAARVHAHIRRQRLNSLTHSESQTPMQTEPVLAYPGLEIDFRLLEVRRGKEKLTLSAKEFELLTAMAKQPNRVFPPGELYRLVWQSDSNGDTRTLMVHISNLRKKMEQDPAHPQWIQTVRGFGYRFCPDGGTSAEETREAEARSI